MSVANDVGFLKSPPPPSPQPSPQPFPPPSPPLYVKSTSEAHMLLLYATVLAYKARPLTPADRPFFIPDELWPPSQRFGDITILSLLTKLVTYPWFFVLMIVLFAFCETEGGRLPGRAEQKLLGDVQHNDAPSTLSAVADLSAFVLSVLGAVPAPAVQDLMQERMPRSLSRLSTRVRTAAGAKMRSMSRLLGLQSNATGVD